MIIHVKCVSWLKEEEHLANKHFSCYSFIFRLLVDAFFSRYKKRRDYQRKKITENLFFLFFFVGKNGLHFSLSDQQLHKTDHKLNLMHLTCCFSCHFSSLVCFLLGSTFYLVQTYKHFFIYLRKILFCLT